MRKNQIFTLLSIILSTIFTVCLLEGISFLALKSVKTAESIPSHLLYFKKKQSLFPNTPETQTLFENLKQANKRRYFPYFGWQSKPFNSKYVNILENGYRKTINPTQVSSDKKKEISVACFGGSSTWGWDNADKNTWPSELSKNLNEQKNTLNYTVENLGENGFDWIQAITRLEHELIHKQKKYDYVFFLVGHNLCDLWSYPGFNGGYHGGTKDYHNRFQQTPLTYRAVFKNQIESLKNKLRQTNTVRLILSLKKELPSSTHTGIIPPITFFNIETESIQTIEFDRFDAEEHTNAVSKLFLDYLDTVEYLSKKYHFKYTVAWQPDIYTTQKQRTDYEKEALNLFGRENSAQVQIRKHLFNRIADKVTTDSRVQDLRGIFKDHKETLFTDNVHLLPAANQIIAKHFASQID